MTLLVLWTFSPAKRLLHEGILHGQGWPHFCVLALLGPLSTNTNYNMNTTRLPNVVLVHLNKFHTRREIGKLL